MAELPAPLPHTVNAVLGHIAEEARMGDGYAISMSDCANACDRAIWYSLHWASTEKPMTGERASMLETGRYWEGRMISELVAAGVKVTFQQKKVSLIDGQLRGKVDGLATNLAEAPVTPHVLECKALNGIKFNGVVKHGVQKHIPDHYAQIQMYMHGEGLKRAAYYIVNKNTEERHLERVEYDPVFCLATLARLEKIANASEPPEKLHDNPEAKAAFQCGFCKHRPVCHGGEFARVNCRTCLHGDAKEPELLICGLLPEAGGRGYKMQQKGCAKHRYIVGLVPGEQIDVRPGDIVVYRLADGSEHIDGDKAPNVEAQGPEIHAPVSEVSDEILF